MSDLGRGVPEIMNLKCLAPGATVLTILGRGKESVQGNVKKDFRVSLSPQSFF